MPAPVALVDHTGAIVACNQSWRDLGGRESPLGDRGSLVGSADHVGTPYVRRLAAMDGPLAPAAHRLARAIQEATSGPAEPIHVAYRVRRPEGEAPFEAVVAALPEARLAFVQHVDHSEGERAEDAEALALRLGLDVETMRSRVRRLERRMAEIGQELHTPITPVRLELHLLSSGALGVLTPEQARVVALALRNVHRWAEGEQAFLRLATDVAPPKQTFDLADLVHATIDGRQTEALQQGVGLSVRAKNALPVCANVDAVRDALDRFLDRALASSPSGSNVAVEARSEERAQGMEALVEVRDSGPSPAPREVRSLFEPWGGRPRGSSPDLSLHHVRLALEADNGRAWAESDGPGQGLLLGLALPMLAPGGFEPVAS
jgi:signal transduction histidine kinase